MWPVYRLLIPFEMHKVFTTAFKVFSVTEIPFNLRETFGMLRSVKSDNSNILTPYTTQAAYRDRGTTHSTLR